MRRSNTEEFIQKAQEIPGNDYIYDKVKYIDSHTKVIIECLRHGDFTQRPTNHLRGQGCPKCVRELLSILKRSSLEEFILKAQKVHGNYTYPKVNYINNKVKVIITCQEHGEFKQTPHDHLNGHGCPECAKELRRSSTREFIQKANKVHGDYIYDKTVYINSKTKVIIRCRRHGGFTQTPTSHLEGHGCSECMKELLSNLKRSSTEEFTQKAQKVHGNKYIYDKINYINNRTKVTIFCKKCKLNFIQTPSNHLAGSGCPACKNSKAEKYISDTFKELNIQFEPQKTFDTCVNPKTARNFTYDFYLPNIHTLLEYDGIFHFEQVYKDHDFKKTKLHDRYKDMWAHKNGYNLIRISCKQDLEKELNKITNII